MRAYMRIPKLREVCEQMRDVLHLAGFALKHARLKRIGKKIVMSPFD